MPFVEDSLFIVKKMESYLPIYCACRDRIAPQLQVTAIVKGDTFTSHGYDHCIRIFQQLNNLLTGHVPFFDDVTKEELFCLGMAVLFHDVYMTKNPEMRASHSRRARDFVRGEFENLKTSVFSLPISDPVIDTIGEIVLAHSDVKDETDRVIERTLDGVKDSIHSGNDGPIRANILAALLRFGDELDCTSARISDRQKLVNRDAVIDNKHWRKCELIREIMPPSAARNSIVLKISDLVFNEGDDKGNDILLIEEVQNKLSRSLQEVNNTVFTPKNVAWWHYNTVELHKESKALICQGKSVDVFAEPITNNQSSAVNIDNANPALRGATGHAQNTPDATKGTNNIMSADILISQKLSKWVLEDKLLQSGHFRIHAERHARDWIDTSVLLEQKDRLDIVVRSFIQILNQHGLTCDNTVIIGEGFPGLIIASQLGFLGGFGCTYMIPGDGTNETKRDFSRLPDIPKSKSIVLVTDVVAQGETLLRSLEHLGSKHGIMPDTVALILAVFYRKPADNATSLPGNITDKLVSLNADFPIQLCNNRPIGCIFRKYGLVEVINEGLVI